jgi:co-chaperonin GroES (HSP10)
MAVENPFDQKTCWQATNEIPGLKAIHDHIIVRHMSFDAYEFTKGGIIMLGDDGKTEGIRPRWAQVYAVGPDQLDVTVGQWIMVEHGRWTRGLKVEIDNEEFVIRRVDPAALIFVSDKEPKDVVGISTAVHASRLQREQYE